jgi:hypothetical protein
MFEHKILYTKISWNGKVGRPRKRRKFSIIGGVGEVDCEIGI